jgi:hypothetical protein
VNEVCTYPDTSCKDSKCKDSGNTEHSTEKATSVHSDEAEGNTDAFENTSVTNYAVKGRSLDLECEQDQRDIKGNCIGEKIYDSILTFKNEFNSN